MLVGSLALWCGEAEAQSARDSVSMAPGLRAAATSVGGSRAVVDSSDVRTAAATTLSELMQARAASVSVMMSGGTLTDGGRVLIRGPSTISTAGAPLLVVDGIRMDDQEDDSLTTASRLDDIAVDDIASIEVLRGPAAATLFGAGASSGVIVVTTKRGAPGPLRVTSSVLADTRQLTTSFPDNYQRRGIIPATGAPTSNCWLTVVARGECTPRTLERWNPLAEQSPFRMGAGAIASVSVSGGSATRDVRLSLTGRRANGNAMDDELSQLHSRLNATQHIGHDVDVNARVAFVGSFSNGSAAGSVIQAGLDGPASADSAAAFQRKVDTLYRHPLEQRLRHLTAGTDATWRHAGWLTVRAAINRDRVNARAVRGFDGFDLGATYVGIGSHVPDSENRSLGRSDRNSSRASAELVHGVLGIAGARGTLIIGTERTTRNRTLIDSLNVSDLSIVSGMREFQSWAVNNASFLSERATFGERFAIGAGVRRERDTAADSMFRLYPSVDASWRTPLALVGGTLRVRAAYGESPQHYASLDAILRSYGGFGGGFGFAPGNQKASDDDAPERMRETEGGVDLDWGPRAHLEATAYRRRITGLVALGPLPPGYGYSTGGFVRKAVSTGLELDARVRLLDRRALRWDLRAVGATQSNHMVGGITVYGTDRSEIADGQPIWGIPRDASTFGDSNGDGILGDREFVPGQPGAELRSSTPTFEGALHSTVSVGSRLTMTAVLDRRSGFVARAGSLYTHCARPRCREAQDPSATIEDQSLVLAQYRGVANSTDASFTRLREIAVRWTVSPALARAGGMRDATIFVGGRDLFTWSSWTGLDPEINTRSRASIIRSDGQGVPLPRRLLIGLELGGGGR